MRDFNFVSSSSSANSNHNSDSSRQRHNHHRPRHENNTNFRTNNNVNNSHRANFHVKSNNIGLDHNIESHKPQESLVFFSQRVPQDIPRTFSNQLPPSYNHHNLNTSQVLPSSSSSKDIQEPKPCQNQRRRSPYLREKEEPENTTSHLPSQHKILRLSKKFDLVEFARNQRRNHIGRNFAVVRNCLPENQLIPILPSSLVGQFP